MCPLRLCGDFPSFGGEAGLVGHGEAVVEIAEEVAGLGVVAGNEICSGGIGLPYIRVRVAGGQLDDGAAVGIVGGAQVLGHTVLCADLHGGVGLGLVVAYIHQEVGLDGGLGRFAIFLGPRDERAVGAYIDGGGSGAVGADGDGVVGGVPCHAGTVVGHDALGEVGIAVGPHRVDDGLDGVKRQYVFAAHFEDGVFGEIGRHGEVGSGLDFGRCGRLLGGQAEGHIVDVGKGYLLIGAVLEVDDHQRGLGLGGGLCPCSQAECGREGGCEYMFHRSCLERMDLTVGEFYGLVGAADDVYARGHVGKVDFRAAGCCCPCDHDAGCGECLEYDLRVSGGGGGHLAAFDCEYEALGELGGDVVVRRGLELECDFAHVVEQYRSAAVGGGDGHGAALECNRSARGGVEHQVVARSGDDREGVFGYRRDRHRQRQDHRGDE